MIVIVWLMWSNCPKFTESRITNKYVLCVSRQSLAVFFQLMLLLSLCSKVITLSCNSADRGHSNNKWHFRGEGGVSKNVTGQFLLVISLVEVDKTCHMGGGGSKKCRKSVTYYLNGPLTAILPCCHFTYVS